MTGSGPLGVRVKGQGTALDQRSISIHTPLLWVLLAYLANSTDLYLRKTKAARHKRASSSHRLARIQKPTLSWDNGLVHESNPQGSCSVRLKRFLIRDVG